ncbi:MAG: hypothetical protein CM15mP127_02850 [Gammaproteobacteria bacterium]|nr:MAG: hypothetical protein CM15mP127_02850 [Gammaproteobacteria bacterium]
MAEKIRRWRALHPIAGTRTYLVPPPGWRAPKDWTKIHNSKGCFTK